jgi:hypothetical protein
MFSIVISFCLVTAVFVSYGEIAVSDEHSTAFAAEMVMPVLYVAGAVNLAWDSSSPPSEPQ